MDWGGIEGTGDFSIDPPSYRDCNKNQLKISIDKPSVEEVSRLLKNSFSRREKHRYECNQACSTTKDPNNILNSQNHLSTKKKLSTWSQKQTHTHTQKTSLINFIFQNKLKQFSEHTLTHVNLVMTKSHCTSTCIKSSKEYCVLYVKNIARLHKCIHVMTIWDMRKSL